MPVAPPTGESRGMSFARTRHARLAAGVVVTIGAAVLFARVEQPGALWRAVSSLPAHAVAAAVAATLAGLALGAVRWRGLLGAAGVEATTPRLFASLLVGAAVNNVVPARGGDAVRVEAVRRQTGASRLAVAGTLLAERMLDGFVLALLLLVGAVLAGAAQSFVVAGAAVAAAIALAAVVVLRLGTRLRGRLAPLLRGVAVFRSPRLLGPGLAVSGSIWLADVVLYASLARGFGIALSLGALLLLVGVGNLALAVPGAAGGPGSFELVTLAGAHDVGVHAASVAAFVLAVHTVIVVPPTLAGAVLARTAFAGRYPCTLTTGAPPGAAAPAARSRVTVTVSPAVTGRDSATTAGPPAKRPAGSGVEPLVTHAS